MSDRRVLGITYAMTLAPPLRYFAREKYDLVIRTTDAHR